MVASFAQAAKQRGRGVQTNAFGGLAIYSIVTLKDHSILCLEQITVNVPA